MCVVLRLLEFQHDWISSVFRDYFCSRRIRQLGNPFLGALVLVASMGYGVVRPTLGGFAPKVLALSGAYFIASATLDVVANVGAIDDLTSGARVFLVLPAAALDGAFILWIFTSLSKTLAQLQQRRQMAKLSLYRYFTNALALSVVLSFVWVVYEMWFKVTDAPNEKWEADWITARFGTS